MVRNEQKAYIRGRTSTDRKWVERKSSCMIWTQAKKNNCSSNKELHDQYCWICSFFLSFFFVLGLGVVALVWKWQSPRRAQPGWNSRKPPEVFLYSGPPSYLLLLSAHRPRFLPLLITKSNNRVLNSQFTSQYLTSLLLHHQESVL